MGKTFTTRVTLQQGVVTRDTAGGVQHLSFETVPTTPATIPAIITPTVDEKYQERFAEDQDSWSIVLAGDWPQIRTGHYIYHPASDQRYEVQRSSPTKRGRVTTLIGRLGHISSNPLEPAAA